MTAEPLNCDASGVDEVIMRAWQPAGIGLLQRIFGFLRHAVAAHHAGECAGMDA